MIAVRHHRYVLVCDAPTCLAVTDLGDLASDADTLAAAAYRSGWLVASPLGPHLCPVSVNTRFHALIDTEFRGNAA